MDFQIIGGLPLLVPCHMPKANAGKKKATNASPGLFIHPNLYYLCHGSGIAFTLLAEPHTMNTQQWE